MSVTTNINTSPLLAGFSGEVRVDDPSIPVAPETESIKIDILYTRKKLETWETITNDEQVSTFLYLWRSVESLFRHALWKRDKYPKDDQSWLSIMNSLMRERLITVKENKTLKTIRQRRNGLLHRSQDRFVHKEDVEDLLTILENVLDKV